MPAKNPDLHGSVPDKSPVALLIIDMINDLEFDEGEQILPAAMVDALNIHAIKSVRPSGVDPEAA